MTVAAPSPEGNRNIESLVLTRSFRLRYRRKRTWTTLL